MKMHTNIRIAAAFTVVIMGLGGVAWGQEAPQLTWNDSTGMDTPIIAGQPTTLVASGDGNAYFALGISEATSAMASPWGTVEIDLYHQTFVLMVDGFDPSHCNFGLGTLDSDGQRQFDFVPFPTGTPFNQKLYMQFLTLSPSSGNFALSSAIGGRCVDLPPVVMNVGPKVTAPGSSVIITGQGLNNSADPDEAPIVTLGNTTLTVLSHSSNQVEALLPMDAHTGYVQLFTPSGSSLIDVDSLAQHVVVSGNSAFEGPGVGSPTSPLTTHSTIVGEIENNTQRDSYWIACTAGQEIFCEVLSFDTTTLQLVDTTGSPNYGSYLDPFVEVFVAEVPDTAIAANDNSGPGVAAIVGNTAPRFIAPYNGVFEVTVSSSYGFSHGCYLLDIDARDPESPVAPRILAIEPNNTTPGIEAAIIAWGLDMNEPGNNTILFQGNGGTIPATPYLDANGRPAAMVPMGAETGHLMVVNASGLGSDIYADALGSHLYIWENGMLEDPSQVQIIGDGAGVVGNITQPLEVDLYEFTATAGQHIKVRAYPFDEQAGRILPGQLFYPNILDPEVLIMGAGGQGYFAGDAHSGPGLAAEIGGPLLASWVAPYTGTFSIGVRSWFSISTGSYLLGLEVD